MKFHFIAPPSPYRIVPSPSITTATIGLIFLLTLTGCAAENAALSSDRVLPILNKAYAWQLAALPTMKLAKNDTPTNWIRGPFYDGSMALYSATHDESIFAAMNKIASENHYRLDARDHPTKSAAAPDAWRSVDAAIHAGIFIAGQPFVLHADDLAIGQLYSELYLTKNNPQMLTPLRARADQIMTLAPRRRDLWFWCDSLYMAPPAFARLTAATGDRKYLDWMDGEYWDSVDFLVDKDEHLFFRDKTYFLKKAANGRKIFWGRGNGWVIAGIVRILQYMPQDYPTRSKYVRLLQEMSQKLASLQQADGFWRASLLDPAAYPVGETSGTALITYALAWGINNNLLSREEYLPVVRSAWLALASTAQPSGKVGFTQLPGASPAPVKADDAAEYGTGAFLLAGTEILKLR